MNRNEKQKLNKIAWELRYKAIEMMSKAGSGHPGPSLSIAEIITVLYFKILRIRPDNPNWEDRDRLILSKGHACPILYAALARLGYFSEDLLWTLRQPGSPLQGHPDMKSLPGIDMTTGSLGNGLSAGVGMALAALKDDKDYYIFVILGDGEIQEGLIWEAAMAASHYQLNNLIAIIDHNGLQSSGECSWIMNMSPISEKWKSFGWDVQEISGHNVNELIKSLELAKSNKNKPSIIIAKTIKGRGVSFMENQYLWHSRRIQPEEAKIALTELSKEIKQYD